MAYVTSILRCESGASGGATTEARGKGESEPCAIAVSGSAKAVLALKRSLNKQNEPDAKE